MGDGHELQPAHDIVDVIMQHDSNGHDILQAFVNNWPKRAGVRRDEFYEQDYAARDPHLLDYPLPLLPFANHPTFERAPEQTKEQVLTWAWLLYNDRVIEIEHLVTASAINMLLYGVIPGAEDFHVRQALQQTLIDEQFHLMMHEIAVVETKRLRRIDEPLKYPNSIVYRKLLEHQDGVSEQWQKNMLTLLWATVSEMTINAYLDLLARAEGIQPTHKKLNWLHNRDEFAHNKIFLEVTKVLFRRLGRKQQRFFVESLPKTLNAFTSHDFSAWSAILERVKLDGREKLVQDCEAEARTGASKLMSDVSGVRRLAAELEIADDVDFGFAKAV
jgi:4-aminobenzoate N-oxygenase